MSELLYFQVYYVGSSWSHGQRPKWPWSPSLKVISISSLENMLQICVSDVIYDCLTIFDNFIDCFIPWRKRFIVRHSQYVTIPILKWVEPWVVYAFPHWSSIIFVSCKKWPVIEAIIRVSSSDMMELQGLCFGSLFQQLCIHMPLNVSWPFQKARWLSTPEFHPCNHYCGMLIWLALNIQ